MMNEETRQELERVLDGVCRFKIGQDVALRSTLQHWATEAKYPRPDRVSRYLGAARVPAGLVVIERMLQQCYGGFQVHYVCAGLVHKETGEPFNKQIVETQLVPYDEVEAIAVELANHATDAGKSE